MEGVIICMSHGLAFSTANNHLIHYVFLELWNLWQDHISNMNHKHWVNFQCLNLFAKKCWCPRPTRERIQQIEHHTKNVRCGDPSEFYSTKFRGKKWKDPWVQKQIVEAWLTFDILSHRILKLCLSLLNRNLISLHLPKKQLMMFFLTVKCQDLPRCIRLHPKWRYPLKVK